MIGDSEEGAADNLQAKLEGRERTNNEGNIARTTSALFSNPSTSTSSSSRQWSAFRNPRIVRVSKAFGGKDRHSKVCTIRGLRDRRIRLSVPTAVQVYDLQDKLGLGQPSKVIDWLIDASKEDIDKLPPLQLPEGFGQRHLNPQQMLFPSFHEPGSGFLRDNGMLGRGPFLTRRHGININESSSVDRREGESYSPHDRDECESLTYSTHLQLGGSRMTEGSSEMARRNSGKGKWIEPNDGQSYVRAADCSNPSNSSQQAQASAQNFFPIVSYPLGGLPPVNPMLPYSGYNTQWEPSSLSLSHLGNHGLQFPSESPLGLNTVSGTAPHALSSLASGLSPTPQLYFCPPAATTPLFPPYPQQMGHNLPMPSSLTPSGLHLISSAMKPFQANMGTRYFHRDDRDDDEDSDG